MKKKIYIAGKVSGESLAECTMKFGIVQKMIEALGHEAVNPLELVTDFKTPWNSAMRICIGKLTQCDAIVLIPDWSSSKGAIFEYEISQHLEMPNFRGTKHGIEDLKAHKWNN
jgi:hypothetical protein